MPKIILLILSSLVTILIFSVLSHSAFAQTLLPCPGPVARTSVCTKDSADCSKTTPDNHGQNYLDRQLISSDRIAQFYINLGNNTNYDSYKMWFDCGTGNEVPATKFQNDSIYVNLDRFNQMTYCEFSIGTHKINVNATNKAGKVDQCFATYTVLDSDTQCKLTVRPPEGIWSGMTTPLTVEGEGLTSSGQFVLYFDNQSIPGQVNTPSFQPITVPKNLMIAGNHQVSLRKYNGAEGQYTTLCPLVVPIGSSPETAGKVSQTGTTSDACKLDPTQCSKAGGDPCSTDPAKPDPKGPGFKTAIGCIHTTPKVLVQDFLTFGVGIGGGLAFMMMLFGAFQMLTSGGNPQNLQGGRDTFQNAIIGLLFIIFSILLMKIIGIDILNLPGFS